MARSRLIKPGLVKNEVLAELGPHAQLLFAMLPCLADREGRLADRPKRIKAEIFPYYDADVDSLLESLATCSERFIIRYEIDGTRYIQITNFGAHQSPHHKEADSIIYACGNHKPSKGQARAKHANLGAHAPNKVKVTRTSNKDRNKDKNKAGNSILAVVEHYQTYHPKARAGDLERRKIAARLAEGFSVDDLTLAVDGCHVSPFHCGTNDRGEKYHKLDLIFRDASHVTQFIEHAQAEGDPKLSERAKRALDESRKWLESK